MKKILFISGILAFLLLPLLLTGWADADDSVKKSLRQGNRQYESADYKAALTSYEAGLAVSPENKTLNFNAAQTAYLIGEYEKAIKYYDNSEDCTEKFLNAGNICFKAGEAVQDDNNQKAEYYIQALQIYKEGIIKFPQNVPLKYNYEAVKEKAEELLDDMGQESGDQNGDGEQNEDSKQNEGGEQSENNGGEQSQNNGSEQSENNGSQENQEQESENGEKQDQKSGQDENSDYEQDESQDGNQDENSDFEQGEGQDGNQDENSDFEQGEGQDGNDEQQGPYSQDEGENGMDQGAIDRILQMLESQEEQSLKNNQEVVGGNEGKYGW